MEKKLEQKLEWLCYENQNYNLKIGKNFDIITKFISSLKLDDLKPLEIISIDYMKEKTVEFYAKYFNLHDVFLVSPECYDNYFGTMGVNNYKNKTTTVDSFAEYYKMCYEVSPFDIPIKLVDGHSMIGEIQKGLIMSNEALELTGMKKIIPFRHIELGKELTPLSSCTYAHEIAHSQLESNPGFVKNYLNKEVISVFIEKVSALELDPSGEMLKFSERIRFVDIATKISELNLDEKFKVLTEEQKLENIMYIRSALLAEKLFDMYINERKDKHRRRYIYDIQDIFDGKQTVEDFIDKNKVTIEQGKNLELIRRHI